MAIVTMTLDDWVREHTAELNQAIIKACPNIGTLDHDERVLWVQNDEGLYNWARSEGADVDGDGLDSERDDDDL